MRLPRTEDDRQHVVTVLCHLLVTIIIAHLASLVTAAPTALSVSSLASYEPCQQITCYVGQAVPDTDTGSCVCPGSNAFRLMKIYDYLTRPLLSSSHFTHQHVRPRQVNTTSSNNATGSSPESPAMTSFIPLPKTDITPTLIQQSLSQQPQTLGQISAVQPFFLAGVIQFTMNLVGSTGSNGMLMNASTKIPALTIGDNVEPSLIIMPETVNDGTEIVTTETATIIAIDMYSSQYLTYWVMLNNGTLVSLLSDCNVHDIDRINPNTAALSIMPSPYTNKKRGTHSASALASQNIADDISRRAAQAADSGIVKRGLAGVNNYNTKMTQESCASMKCTMDGQLPLWNVFTANCYCDTSPAYWTVNQDGDDAAATG